MTVKVFDPDFELVAVPVQDEARIAGTRQETWTGRDVAGRIVPDEAYFFTIEARDPKSGEVVVYDPVTFSGGEPYDLQGGQFDRISGSLSYQLPGPSRVLVRLGIPGSALLKTLVDWEPRVGGTVTEYWTGRDEDNLINLWERDFATLITYYTLPASSVITYGNRDYDYRSYKNGLDVPRPAKAARAYANARQISPHFTQSRLTDRSFGARLSFPEAGANEVGIPSFNGNEMLVRIDVAPQDASILEKQQFEVIVFLDTVFVAEEERGYLPMNFPVELAQIPEGEHILTVNIATFGGQIGVGSVRFQVER